MVVLAVESLLHKSFKTVLTVVVPESGYIIVAHLIDYDADNQFWSCLWLYRLFFLLALALMKSNISSLKVFRKRGKLRQLRR